MCCDISPPRNAPTAPAATAPRPARFSTKRVAAISRLTTIGVDTTPLFVMLAGAYYARTADLDFMTELWPAIIAALQLDRCVRRYRR